MQNPLVVFDLGNVLIRIATDWKHACAVAGVPFKSAWPLDESRRAALHELVVLNEIGQMGHDDFCKRAGAIFELEPHHIAAVSDAYLMSPFEGVDALIDELIARGVETACLSNTNESHWKLMFATAGPTALPLHKLTHRFASQEIGARKPDDAVYAHVERLTNRTPDRIVFFDDKLENLLPAERRGWKTLLIDPLDPNPIHAIRAKLGQLNIL